MLETHFLSNRFSDPDFKDIKKTPIYKVVEEKQTFSTIPCIFTSQHCKDISY